MTNLTSAVTQGFGSAHTYQVIGAAGTYTFGKASIGVSYSNVKFENLGSTFSAPTYAGETATFNVGELKFRYFSRSDAHARCCVRLHARKGMPMARWGSRAISRPLSVDGSVGLASRWPKALSRCAGGSPDDYPSITRRIRSLRGALHYALVARGSVTGSWCDAFLRRQRADVKRTEAVVRRWGECRRNRIRRV